MAPSQQQCAKYQYVITPEGPRVVPVPDIPSKNEESASDYNVGGYLPVKVGDVYKNGRYKVVRKLGWGHFSTVWLVHDTHQNVHSALKVVKSASRYAETARDEIKLLQQVTTSSSLNHHGRPHVVNLLDHFTHPALINPHPPLRILQPGEKRGADNLTHVCIVFEPLGENLLSLLERCKKLHEGKPMQGLPSGWVKIIATQALKGLEYLHDVCGLIHTDIKPENIMISIPKIEFHIEHELANSPSPTSRNVNVPPPSSKSRMPTSSFFASTPSRRMITSDRNVQIFDSQPLSSPSTIGNWARWRGRESKTRRELEVKEKERQLKELPPPNIVAEVAVAATVTTTTTVTATGTNGTAPIDVPTVSNEAEQQSEAEEIPVSTAASSPAEASVTVKHVSASRFSPPSSPKFAQSSSFSPCISLSPSPASDSSSGGTSTSLSASSSRIAMSTPATSISSSVSAGALLSHLTQAKPTASKKSKWLLAEIDEKDTKEGGSGSGISTEVPNTVVPSPSRSTSNSEAGNSSGHTEVKTELKKTKKRKDSSHQKQMSKIETELDAALNTNIMREGVKAPTVAVVAAPSVLYDDGDEDEGVIARLRVTMGPPSPALTEDSNRTVTNAEKAGKKTNGTETPTTEERKDHPPMSKKSGQSLLSRTAPLDIPNSHLSAHSSSATSSKSSSRTGSRSHSRSSSRAAPPLLVKVADLGNATPISRHYTEDIQTRQYRSPEILLGRSDWGPTADIWSLACVLFELLTGDYLFEPTNQPGQFGKDDDHMAQIIELLGDIPADLKKGGRYSGNLFDSVGKLRYIQTLKPWRLERVLVEKYAMREDKAKIYGSFLGSMLDVDYRKRVEARDVVKHEWLELTDEDGLDWPQFQATPAKKKAKA